MELMRHFQEKMCGAERNERISAHYAKFHHSTPFPSVWGRKRMVESPMPATLWSESGRVSPRRSDNDAVAAAMRSEAEHPVRAA